MRALCIVALVCVSAAAQAAPVWRLPVQAKKLANGLTVIVSEDHSSPTFGLCIEYGIGWRREPRNRTGFAHLFEHMMFEGTPRSPKGVADRVMEDGGGLMDGFTRSDSTSYIETGSLGALDAVLWLEADRMRALDFSEKNLKNQQQVVKEEVRVNVLNQPYAMFYWIDMAKLAWDKWASSHDGYGSFQDLDAAKMEDVKAFFDSYYGPNNAVLVIVGDVVAADLFARVEKQFGALPARPLPPAADVDEGLASRERTLSQSDPLAKTPALAVAWRMPAPGSKDQMAGAVLGALLADGDSSRLYLGLVKGRELVASVNGGVNWPIGNPLMYRGPTLLTVEAPYKPNVTGKQVLGAVDEEVRRVARDGVSPDELQRVKTKMRSDFYRQSEEFLGRAVSLADAQWNLGDARALFDIPARIEAVTAEDVRRVAATYLTAGNRSSIDRRPAAAPTKPIAQSEGGAR